MAQILRPDSTITSVNWAAVGAATHHECVDDVIADDATTYVASGVGTSSLIMTLGAGVDPSSNVDHTIHIRLKAVSATPLVVSLLEGASTTRANFFIPTVDTSWTDYSYTLSGVEADSITDYSDLRIRLWGLPSSNVVDCTQVYFSIPDAPSTRRVFIIS